ncbi:MAG: hypothetical protein ACRDYW_05920 [Acidimicrobiales bacterium]
MAGPVVVLELNELCPPLVERFIDEGVLPGFARLRRESHQFVTDAEEGPGRLNPWVQWVTLHTGVPLDEHGALRLGDGTRVTQPTVGELASEGGARVWLCSPMNVVPHGPVRGAYLPDPWIDAEPQPASLRPFHRFVRASVQEHSNPSARLSPAQVAAFLWFLLRHGLRPATVVATARQLASERRGGPRWKRVALLDRFQWDVFRRVLRRERPDLATFFSNSTAHLQHHYWRYLEPEQFDPRPSPEELERFGGAVRYGYEQMDRMVGEALDLVGSTGTLVLCTALSQQAYRKGEVAGKGAFHRPHDLEAFAVQFGLDGVTSIAPVMAEQFHLLFAEAALAERAMARLETVQAEDAPVFALRRDGDDLFVGCARFGDVDPATPLVGPAGIPATFGDAFYRSETGQSGMHHPDGLLWIRPPGGAGSTVGPTQRVSLLDVAPTLLSLVGVAPAPHMHGRPLVAPGTER